MKILAIVGLPGSGKTTAIEAIQELGMVITMGDIVRDEAKKRNLEPSGINIGKLAQELRKNEGPDIIAQKCVELIKKTKSEIIFIDGIRSLDEVKIFRKYWRFPIIAIILDEKKRFKRLLKRSRSDDPKNLQELIDRDIRELEFGLDKVLEIADYKINNNSSVDNLKKKTREVVLKIIEHY